MNTPNIETLTQLIKIGFVEAGRWHLNEDDKLTFTINGMGDTQPALYAFVIDERVMYVGKTKKKARQRLDNYTQASGSQLTNVRINRTIVPRLHDGIIVKIYIFADPEPQRMFAGLPVDLAAGIESAVINKLSPLWNKAS